MPPGLRAEGPGVWNKRHRVPSHSQVSDRAEPPMLPPKTTMTPRAVSNAAPCAFRGTGVPTVHWRTSAREASARRAKPSRKKNAERVFTGTPSDRFDLFGLGGDEVVG